MNLFSANVFLGKKIAFCGSRVEVSIGSKPFFSLLVLRVWNSDTDLVLTPPVSDVSGALVFRKASFKLQNRKLDFCRT